MIVNNSKLIFNMYYNESRIKRKLNDSLTIKWYYILYHFFYYKKEVSNGSISIIS